MTPEQHQILMRDWRKECRDTEYFKKYAHEVGSPENRGGWNRGNIGGEIEASARIAMQLRFRGHGWKEIAEMLHMPKSTIIMRTKALWIHRRKQPPGLFLSYKNRLPEHV